MRGRDVFVFLFVFAAQKAVLGLLAVLVVAFVLVAVASLGTAL